MFARYSVSSPNQSGDEFKRIPNKKFTLQGVYFLEGSISPLPFLMSFPLITKPIKLHNPHIPFALFIFEYHCRVVVPFVAFSFSLRLFTISAFHHLKLFTISWNLSKFSLRYFWEKSILIFACLGNLSWSTSFSFWLACYARVLEFHLPRNT